MTDSLSVTRPEVSVIVPARNEEASLGTCLQSLVEQTGLRFEIIVVDDHSIDCTRAIAQSFPGVEVVTAPPLPSGWTGKNNALVYGATRAQGYWLLFTDADTVHLQGSLQRALEEAREQGAALLSYSPEQVVHGLAEKAIMPVIFAELALTYRPSQVSDPGATAAAANGQYLLIRRDAYDAVGGHAAVPTSLLEDVALAQGVKRSGRRIYFRYGGDAVRTRMYRTFAQLREGWTKNLALLFPGPRRLAVVRTAEFGSVAAGFVVAVIASAKGQAYIALPAALATALTYALFVRRVRKAHFSWLPNLLAIFGLPLFSYLLWRSQLCHRKGTVAWRGRLYSGVETMNPVNARQVATEVR